MALENFDEELWESLLKSMPFSCLTEWIKILGGQVNNPGFMKSQKYVLDSLITEVKGRYYMFNNAKVKKKSRQNWLPYYEQNKALSDQELKEVLTNKQIFANVVIGFLVEGTAKEVAKIKQCFFDINPLFTEEEDIEKECDNTENDIILNENCNSKCDAKKKLETLEKKMQKTTNILLRVEAQNKDLEEKRKQQSQYLKEKAIFIKKLETEKNILQNANDILQAQNEKLCKENGTLQITINEYKDHISSLDYQLKSFRGNLIEQNPQEVVHKNSSEVVKIGLWKMMCDKSIDNALEMIPVSSEMTKDEKALHLLFSAVNEIWYLPEKINRFEINKITKIFGSIEPAPKLVQINNEIFHQYALSEDIQ